VISDAVELDYRPAHSLLYFVVADQFSDTDVTHLLVIERSVSDGSVVCGLLSRTRLARQLGITIPVLLQ